MISRSKRTFDRFPYLLDLPEEMLQLIHLISYQSLPQEFGLGQSLVVPSPLLVEREFARRRGEFLVQLLHAARLQQIQLIDPVGVSGDACHDNLSCFTTIVAGYR